MLLPVIMAGGYGSRLWPMSRQLNPKQFLKLGGEMTMLQATIGRLQGIEHAAPFVICNEEHRFLVAEQLRQIGLEGSPIMLEPEGRNTAPAIAVAALQATADGDDPILLVLAADHLIRDISAFHAAIEKAVKLADDGKLVTFGVPPSHPETGYGYVRRGQSLGSGFTVDGFVEKPSLEKAVAYLDSGDYFWNSGMFVFKASRYLQELERWQPEVPACCRTAVQKAQRDLGFVRLDKKAFSECPEISVDYAVMEKTSDAAVVPLDAGWSDIGSWSALWDVSDKDGAGNAVRGDVVSIDTGNSFIRAEHRLVATVGVSDLVIIETKDALLVAHKDKVQSVKDIVNLLRQKGRSEYAVHREVYRPWGQYDAIDSGSRYQVKRITVKPGAKLSVQMHHHRAEHWVVVSGTAKVFNGDKTYLVTENESTFIPIGQVHSLENPGKIPLELIEVQSGGYLGEDDIIRFEDKYGR